MKNQFIIRYLFPILILTVSFFFICSDLIHPQRHINIRWAINSRMNLSENQDKDIYCWESKNSLGYFSKKGEITLRVDKKDYNMINKFGIIQVDYSLNELYYIDANNIHNWSMPTNHTPYYSGDFPFFYMINNNQRQLSIMSYDGAAMLKDLYLPSSISAISSNFRGETFIGLINGNGILINSMGKIIKTIQTSKSKYTFIKAAQTSINGEFLCYISGINPEIITILNNSKTVSFQTRSPILHTPYISFNQNNNRLIIEKAEGGFFYYKLWKELKEINGPPNLWHAKFSPKTDSFICTYKLKNNFNLTYYNSLGNIVFSYNINDSINTLHFIGKNEFFISTSDKLVYFSRE